MSWRWHRVKLVAVVVVENFDSDFVVVDSDFDSIGIDSIASFVQLQVH